jgi:hypothetical protein
VCGAARHGPARRSRLLRADGVDSRNSLACACLFVCCLFVCSCGSRWRSSGASAVLRSQWAGCSSPSSRSPPPAPLCSESGLASYVSLNLPYVYAHARALAPCPRKPFPRSLSVVVVPVVHVVVLDGAPVRAVPFGATGALCRAVPAQVSSALCEPAANVLVSYDGRKTLRPSPSASLVRGPTHTIGLCRRPPAHALVDPEGRQWVCKRTIPKPTRPRANTRRDGAECARRANAHCMPNAAGAPPQASSWETDFEAMGRIVGLALMHQVGPAAHPRPPSTQGPKSTRST